MLSNVFRVTSTRFFWALDEEIKACRRSYLRVLYLMKIVLLLPIIASCFLNVSCVTLKLELGWSHQKDTEKADQATPEILDK